MASKPYLRLSTLFVIFVLAGCKGPVVTQKSASPPSEPTRQVAMDVGPVKSANLHDEQYKNGQHKFAIQFPKQFKKFEENVQGMVICYRDDTTGANFNIRCPRIPPGASLQGLFNEMQALPKSVENGKEMARGDLDISGIPCKWISISHTKQGIRTRLVVYLVVKEPISYMVFCTAPEEKARKYEPLFEESMKSFRLL